MEAFGPLLSTRKLVQVQLSPKKKKKLSPKRENADLATMKSEKDYVYSYV